MLLGRIHAIKQAFHNGWTDNRQKRSTELSKALPLVLIYKTPVFKDLWYLNFLTVTPANSCLSLPNRRIWIHDQYKKIGSY